MAACTRAKWLGTIVWVAVGFTGVSGAEVSTLLEQLRSSDSEVRRAGWLSAREYGAAAVPSLVTLAADANLDRALAATRALRGLVGEAGRPEKENGDVVRALVESLEDARVDVGVKTVVIELLGRLGEEAAVASLGGALLDTRLREAARRSLERIPGARATQALVDALAGSAGPFREALLVTLGRRGDPIARAPLRRLLQLGPLDEREAAAWALARVGEEEEVDPLLDAFDRLDERAQRSLGDELLSLAHRLERADKRGVAVRLYEGVFERSTDGSVRGAALSGWCGENPDEHLFVLIDALAVSSQPVHDAVADLLTRAKGVDVDAKVFAVYGTSSEMRKATLLRVLYRRGTPGYLGVLRRARDDASGDVRVAAFELLGELDTPEAERAFALGIADGTEETRRRAQRRYLALADGKIADVGDARQMYRQLMEGADDPLVRGRALVGLARLGDPILVRWLEKSRSDPRLRLAVTEAEFYVARAMGLIGQREAAIKKLMEVVCSPAVGDDLRVQAAQLIAELGGDAKGEQRAQGYLTDWWVLGPFPNSDGRGLETPYSPEKAVHLTAQIDHRDRQRRWRSIETVLEHGLVDFASFFRRSHHVVGYAYAELNLASEREVTVNVGSSGSFAVWVNGEQLVVRRTGGGFVPETMKATARLQRGKNQILVKVANESGEWRFGVRLLSPAGPPVDLTEIVGG